jgi:hypothetical protein
MIWRRPRGGTGGCGADRDRPARDLEPHADVVLADIGAIPDWLSGLKA